MTARTLYSETCDFEALPEPRRYWPVMIEMTEKRIPAVSWADLHPEEGGRG